MKLKNGSLVPYQNLAQTVYNALKKQISTDHREDGSTYKCLHFLIKLLQMGCHASLVDQPNITCQNNSPAR